jgi:hypothetical protein
VERSSPSERKGGSRQSKTAGCLSFLAYLISLIPAYLQTEKDLLGFRLKNAQLQAKMESLEELMKVKEKENRQLSAICDGLFAQLTTSQGGSASQQARVTEEEESY